MRKDVNIPKGYRQTSLGLLPKEWNVLRLRDLGRVLSGLTYSPSEIDDDGVLVLRSSNIKNRRISLDDNVYVKSNCFNEVHAGDILICVRNGSGSLIGKNALITPLVEGSAFGAFMAVFRSDNNSYLFQLFDTSYYYRNVYRNLGATINSINGTDLLNFSFPIPPLAEQRKIAEVLSTWDKAIELQTAIIDKLTLRKKGLMQQLLTGKKRFKSFSEPFCYIKAGEVFRSSSIKGAGTEELLSATQENGVVPRRLLEGRVTMPAGNTDNFKLVEKGDFVISLRSFQGGIEYSEYQGIVSPAYIVLKPKLHIDDSFYKYYFKSSDFIGHLAIAVIGIRDGRQISYDDFCFVKIPFPSLGEQCAISEILVLNDREIEKEKQKLEALKQQKKGLMQQLLTGKKRIKTK